MSRSAQVIRASRPLPGAGPAGRAGQALSVGQALSAGQALSVAKADRCQTNGLCAKSDIKPSTRSTTMSWSPAG